ncbi:MAG: sulfurtransferase [Ferruginibacter sp.]
MNPPIPPIISPTELINFYHNPGLVLADVRTGPNAKENYFKKHLEGALFVDLDTQLADIKEDVANGGRHPLPEINVFAETLTKLGISKQSHVVIYDDKNAANAAARFWWMLKAAGHQHVQVIDGGMQAAEKSGFPTGSRIEKPKMVLPYSFDSWQLPLADMQEVEKVSADENYMVVDVRDAARYRGEQEPIDLVAGHIPGAVNIPFTNNLDEHGLFLSPAELKKIYQIKLGDKATSNIIVHCGSGVTACHSLLAIAYAGMEIPKLYIGSWSEWSRNNKTIAKG